MNWNTTENQRLIRALLTIGNRPDIIRDFLDDLLTEKEIRTCVQRLEIAYWLSLGTPYSTIQKITGAGHATIARVSKLFDNRNGGLNAAIKRMRPRRPGYIN